MKIHKKSLGIDMIGLILESADQLQIAYWSNGEVELTFKIYNEDEWEQVTLAAWEWQRVKKKYQSKIDMWELPR